MATLPPGTSRTSLEHLVHRASATAREALRKAASARPCFPAPVLAPGEKLSQKGLIYAATPASDFICGTLQVAAGMNLHVFTTGRGRTMDWRRFR